MSDILHGLAPVYLNCAIARSAPTRVLQSSSDATLLAVGCRREQSDGAALRCPAEIIARVCAISWNIGNFPETSQNLSISLASHASVALGCILMVTVAWF